MLAVLQTCCTRCCQSPAQNQHLTTDSLAVSLVKSPVHAQRIYGQPRANVRPDVPPFVLRSLGLIYWWMLYYRT